MSKSPLFVRGIQNLKESLGRTVVTIGNFDGVHAGHRKIIETAVGQARKRKASSVAFTFRPHPQIALKPGSNLQLLSTYDEKLQLLAETGLDVIVEEPFSREFSTTTPVNFFNDVLIHRLSAEAVVV